jgi:hypothetical protein
VQLINTTTNQNISAWHDLPLGLERSANGSATIWVLVEIPEGEQAKYETRVSLCFVMDRLQQRVRRLVRLCEMLSRQTMTERETLVVEFHVELDAHEAYRPGSDLLLYRRPL